MRSGIHRRDILKAMGAAAFASSAPARSARWGALRPPSPPGRAATSTGVVTRFGEQPGNW